MLGGRMLLVGGRKGIAWRKGMLLVGGRKGILLVGGRKGILLVGRRKGTTLVGSRGLFFHHDMIDQGLHMTAGGFCRIKETSRPPRAPWHDHAQHDVFRDTSNVVQRARECTLYKSLGRGFKGCAFNDTDIMFVKPMPRRGAQEAAERHCIDQHG